MVIARSGISGGRRVPSGALLNTKPRGGDDVSLYCLGEEGLTEIAQKIFDDEQLNAQDLTYLLKRASMSALMKLVAMKASGPRPVPRVTPIVILPVESWFRALSYSDVRESANRFLDALPYAEIDVTPDWFDLSRFDQLCDLTEYLSRRRPGARFLGPRVEELISSLADKPPKGRLKSSPQRGRNAPATIPAVEPLAMATTSESRTVSPTRANRKALTDILHALRRSGFFRIRYITDSDLIAEWNLLEILRDAGLQTVVGTRVDLHHDVESLVTDIIKMRSLSSESEMIDIWVSALSESFEGVSGTNAAHDMSLLRTLALGTLGEVGARVKRASATFLSLEALSMARHFGADDYGYGAVDQYTAERLRILPLTAMSALSVV